MNAPAAAPPLALAPDAADAADAADAFDAAVMELGTKLDLDDIIAKLGGHHHHQDGRDDAASGDAAATAGMPPPPPRPPSLRRSPWIGGENGVAKRGRGRRVRVRVIQHAQKPAIRDRCKSSASSSTLPDDGIEWAHFRTIDQLLDSMKPPAALAAARWDDASLCDLYA